MNDADWIRLSLQVIGLAGGAIGVVMAVRTQVAVITTRVDMHATTTAAAIAELRAEMKSVATLSTQQAVLDQRLLAIEKRVDALAHGEGMVLPLFKGQRGRET